MAVSTNSYFSNAIIGVPQIGADIDLYESNTSPKYAVGFGFTRGDGNKYRYCQFGALIARGAVAATDVSESGLAKKENVGATVANLTKPVGERVNPNVIDSTYLQLTITATASQFAGGYIAITSGNGAGFTYHIKGNTVTGDPVTGDCYVELYDKVVVAIDSNSDIAIAGCKYANLEGSTITDKVPAGVTVTNNSASSYGWVTTGGLTGALQDANVPVIGQLVTLSTNTTGAITPVPTTSSGSVYASTPVLGYYVEAGSSADYSLVCLTLE